MKKRESVDLDTLGLEGYINFSSWSAEKKKVVSQNLAFLNLEELIETIKDEIVRKHHLSSIVSVMGYCFNEGKDVGVERGMEIIRNSYKP